MKTRVTILAVLGLLCAGCANITGTRGPDGSLSIQSQRFLWASEGIEFSLRDTNGFKTTLNVKKSSSHAEAIAAAFAGAKDLMATSKP